MAEFIKGKTYFEKRVIFNNIIHLIEDKGYTLRQVGEEYKTSRQAIEQFLKRNNYSISKISKSIRETNVDTKNLLKSKKATKQLSMENIKYEEDKEVEEILNKCRTKITNLKNMLCNRRKRVEELTSIIKNNNNNKVEKLKAENKMLKTENKNLVRRTDTLEVQIKELTSLISNVKARNIDLKNKLKRLEQQI